MTKRNGLREHLGYGYAPNKYDHRLRPWKRDPSILSKNLGDFIFYEAGGIEKKY